MSIDTLMGDDLIGRLQRPAYDIPGGYLARPCQQPNLLDRCLRHVAGFCYHADPREGPQTTQRYVEHCQTCRAATPLESEVREKSLTHSQVSARVSWDEYFLRAADNARLRSTCSRGRCGTVLVDRHHRLISSGYSGRGRGEAHCDEVGCLVFADHDVLSVHSEYNACRQIWEVYCALRGWDPDAHDWTDFLAPLGVTAYVVTPKPICSGCARTMWAVGIRNEPIVRMVEE